MANIYLNEFHRQRSERLKKQLSMQPKASLAEALQQYKRIKRGSSRHRGLKKLSRTFNRKGLA